MPKTSSRSRSKSRSRSSTKSMKVPNLLKNPISLWVLAIIAAAMIINYVAKSQFTSLLVILAVGFLSTMFTKNMVITLLVAVGVTLLFRQFGGVKEGMKEGVGDAEEEEKGEKKLIKPVNLPNSKSIGVKGPKEPKEPVNLPNSKSIGLTEKDCEIRAKSGECFKNPVWMYDVCNNECDKQNNILMNIITPQSTSTNLSETTSSANSITKPKNSDTSTITMNDGNKFNTSSNNTVVHGKPKKK